MLARHRYLAALATAVARAPFAYGYTISVWTAGAVIEHGRTAVGQAYLFLPGTAAGFALVALLGWRAVPHELHPAPGGSAARRRGQRVRAGAGARSRALVAMIPGTAAHLLGSFAVTTVYLLVASIGPRRIASFPGRPPDTEPASGPPEPTGRPARAPSGRRRSGSRCRRSMRRVRALLAGVPSE